MKLLYFHQGRPAVNFGDFITAAILETLGAPLELLTPRTPPGEPVFFGVGTMFADWWLDRAGFRPVVVWGSGYGGAALSPANARRFDVRAVRGPLTRDFLGLPPSTPLGDPALLLPRLFTFQAGNANPPVYVPHWQHAERAGAEAVQVHAETLGAEVLSPMISPNCAALRGVLERLAGARFVYTSSLHGAIVAQAYGVPWAPALMPGEAFNLEHKWHDFAALLGIDLAGARGPYQMLSARQWWQAKGAKGRTPDLEPLARAFPLSPGF